MDAAALIQRAQRYLRCLNERRLEVLFGMFRRDATYRSDPDESREGLQQIAAMLRASFGEFPVCTWEAEGYALAAPDTVSFSFEMVGERAGSGSAVARSGTERISFDDEGRIVHVEVTLDSEVEIDRDEALNGSGAVGDSRASESDDDLVAELFGE